MRPGRPRRPPRFTLIEVAVVITIVALLAGAIVVGRDLAQAGQLRSQVAQFERFDAAVNAFSSKYDSLPGDLHAADATALGFVARSGADGHGDGDQILEGCEAYQAFSVNVPLGCEVLLFWSDLDRAGLSPMPANAATDDYLTVTTFEETLQYFPISAVTERATVVPVRCLDGHQYYDLIRTRPSFVGPLRPGEASRIDAKIDDGLPLSGRTLVRSPGFTADAFFCAPPIQGVNLCVFGNVYGRNPTVASCALLVRVGGGAK